MRVDPLDENQALLGSDLGEVKLPSGQCLEMGEFHNFTQLHAAVNIIQ